MKNREFKLVKCQTMFLFREKGGFAAYAKLQKEKKY